jgi:hypothetical protein
MCTVITKAQKHHPKTAKENITVYKIGKVKEDKFHPHYMPEFYYVKDKCHKQNLLLEILFMVLVLVIL